MSDESFDVFFERATGSVPYPYQRRVATDPEPPELLSVPTGLGKTAAAVLSWVWRRRFADPAIRERTPRRLVYCLPMRVLVEQTRDCARTWLGKLGLLEGEGAIGVHLLMGGDVDDDWDQYPERDAILVGTQDMLLSRALNRGYAMSRFRWPMPFGLLNNDCQWVMDEVQLMGNGLATTAQLEGLRRQLGTVAPVRSLWMSATMRPEWLRTVDFDPVGARARGLGIGDDDRARARARLEAKKPLTRAPFAATEDGKAEASIVIEQHAAGSRTLVVVNTVKRAQTVFQAIQKRRPDAELVLIHSRFRPPDRRRALERLLAPPGERGLIAVCTQVVEAGVDVSARLLVTDLAPWASLVQRFGRCNRAGEREDASVVWIAHAHLDDDKLKAAPYEADALRAAATTLSELSDAGPRSLPEVSEARAPTHVLRRKDLVELFDTTPDLAGADIDISRFIREADDHDAQVFWREIAAKEAPAPDEPAPRRDELCAVPVGELAKREAFRWDHVERRWVKPEAVFPGLVLLMRACDGGYSPELGWVGNKSKRTAPVPGASAPGVASDSNDDDRYAAHGRWETIAEHTDGVVASVTALLAALRPAADPWRSALLEAARFHDAGKAHPVFQGAMPEGAPATALYAKAAAPMRRYERPGFRHELASALAMLASGRSDLASYLAGAHHGKVRLSIRSLPTEKPPPGEPERRFARGLFDGERLPAVDLGGGVTLPATELALSFMELGEDPVTGPSWLARALALRDDPGLGPFRLVFLEALLRVADWRASGAGVSASAEEVTR